MVDNLAKKNSVKVRGLKEQVEGDNLCIFMKDLFTSWVGSESNEKVKLELAYRIGPIRKYHHRNPRDMLVKLSTWQSKLKVVEAFQENPDGEIGGSKITVE